MEGVLKIQILSIVISLIFLAVICYFIVKGKLREEYSITWILCVVPILVFSIWREGLNRLGQLFGVQYPPALFFLAAIFLILVFLIHLSIVNSRQHEKIKHLAQEVALLKEQLKSKSELEIRTDI